MKYTPDQLRKFALQFKFAFLAGDPRCEELLGALGKRTGFPRDACLRRIDLLVTA